MEDLCFVDPTIPLGGALTSTLGSQLSTDVSTATTASGYHVSSSLLYLQLIPKNLKLDLGHILSHMNS